MALGVSSRATVAVRRRHWVWRVVAAGVAVLLVAASVGFLLLRQWTRPLTISLDDNATGDIHAVNTRYQETGQWFAPYGPRPFDLAITFFANGRGVRLDRVEIGGGDVPQGPVTYDINPESASQAVLPAAQRRPLHETLIPANAEQTVVVPFRYLCDPRQQGTLAEFTQAYVTWQLWGEHHTQWMSLPQPLITQTGRLCPGAGPMPGPAGS